MVVVVSSPSHQACSPTVTAATEVVVTAAVETDVIPVLATMAPVSIMRLRLTAMTLAHTAVAIADVEGHFLAAVQAAGRHLTFQTAAAVVEASLVVVADTTTTTAEGILTREIVVRAVTTLRPSITETAKCVLHVVRPNNAASTTALQHPHQLSLNFHTRVCTGH